MDKVVHFFPTWVFVRELLKKVQVIRLEKSEIRDWRSEQHSCNYPQCG
ncbi:hypothetical protein CpphoP_0024 [Corynebacterium pseudotuberculosis]|nr:hypothetical protein CpphoP_0024 [Corynebacterium pseudotuberculosis]